MLAVGGTNLTLDADNTIASIGRLERHRLPGAVHRTAGGGGGSSTFEARPWWQPAQSFASSGKRMVPDVAAFADESPGYPIVCSSGVQGCKGSGQSIAFVGGTSAAAPLVAGMIALWNQQAHDQGLPRPGFVAPLLTSLAKHSPPGVHRHHPGHQRPVRRLVLPDPDRLRPGHRLGLAQRERHRRTARRGRVTQARSCDRRPVERASHDELPAAPAPGECRPEPHRESLPANVPSRSHLGNPSRCRTPTGEPVFRAASSQPAAIG